MSETSPDDGELREFLSPNVNNFSSLNIPDHFRSSYLFRSKIPRSVDNQWKDS